MANLGIYVPFSIALLSVLSAFMWLRLTPPVLMWPFVVTTPFFISYWIFFLSIRIGILDEEYLPWWILIFPSWAMIGVLASVVFIVVAEMLGRRKRPALRFYNPDSDIE